MTKTISLVIWLGDRSGMRLGNPSPKLVPGRSHGSVVDNLRFALQQGKPGFLIFALPAANNRIYVILKTT